MAVLNKFTELGDLIPKLYLKSGSLRRISLSNLYATKPISYRNGIAFDLLISRGIKTAITTNTCLRKQLRAEVSIKENTNASNYTLMHEKR